MCKGHNTFDENAICCFDILKYNTDSITRWKSSPVNAVQLLCMQPECKLKVSGGHQQFDPQKHCRELGTCQGSHVVQQYLPERSMYTAVSCYVDTSEKRSFVLKWTPGCGI